MDRFSSEENKDILFQIIQDVQEHDVLYDHAKICDVGISRSHDVDVIRKEIETDVKEAAQLNDKVFSSVCRFCSSVYIFSYHF
jgi:hypothetical protein